MIKVASRLNSDAREFSTANGSGFGFSLFTKVYDFRSKKDIYLNYDAVVFSKSDKQSSFYRSALVKGAVVEATAEGVNIKEYNGKYRMELANIIMGSVKVHYYPEPSTTNSNQQQQHTQASSVNQPSNNTDFDDTIPF